VFLVLCFVFVNYKADKKQKRAKQEINNPFFFHTLCLMKRDLFSGLWARHQKNYVLKM